MQDTRCSQQSNHGMRAAACQDSWTLTLLVPPTSREVQQVSSSRQQKCMACQPAQMMLPLSLLPYTAVQGAQGDFEHAPPCPAACREGPQQCPAKTSSPRAVTCWDCPRGTPTPATGDPEGSSLLPQPSLATQTECIAPSKLHGPPLAAASYCDCLLLPRALPCPPHQQAAGLAAAPSTSPYRGPSALP